jgi:hypothetical protein
MESSSDRTTLSEGSEKALTEDYNQTRPGQMVSIEDGDEVDGKSEVASATADKVSDQFADT